MAKINHFIASYTDRICSTGITPDGGLPPKRVIRRFLRVFREVDDQRAQGMIDYPLEEIVLIAFLAILGNASTWAEIERFGKVKERWLRKFIRLKNGMPSHDTFRRVFSLIDTEQLQEAAVAFLLENLSAIKKALGISPADGRRHLCVDGKEQRGSGRKYNTPDEVRNLQTLHIYDASNEICIYSEAISSKTNEIPVAQEALKSFICCIKTMTSPADNTEKTEVRYYASSIDDTELAAEAIRGHWSVENGLHWHLDHSFQEDDNTTTDKTAFHNFSLINKMALSLCKLAKPVTGSPSIRILRKSFGWGFEEMLSLVLLSFDEIQISSALKSAK